MTFEFRSNDLAAVEIAAQMRTRIRRDWPYLRSALEELARVPSVSTAAFDSMPVLECARRTADLFTAAGFAARVLEHRDAQPAVMSTVSGPPDAPRILLYA